MTIEEAILQLEDLKAVDKIINAKLHRQLQRIEEEDNGRLFIHSGIRTQSFGA